MDGLLKSKERVFILAASNLPWDLDVAMLRRLEKRVKTLDFYKILQILVPLPESECRIDMLRKYLPVGIA